MNPLTFLYIYSGVVGAYGERVSGQIQKTEYDLEAKQIELNTLERERERKDRLNAALAASMARTGASGVAMEGSPFANLKEMESQTQKGIDKDLFNARLNKMTARARGKMAVSGGKARAALTLGTSAINAIDASYRYSPGSSESESEKK